MGNPAEATNEVAPGGDLLSATAEVMRHRIAKKGATLWEAMLWWSSEGSEVCPVGAGSKTS